MAFFAPSTKEILLDAIAQTLGEHTIETVRPVNLQEVQQEGPTEPPHNGVLCMTQTAVPNNWDSRPVCVTQKAVPRNLEHGPADIVVGFESECPRWAPGSVIKWAAWRPGFDSKQDADYAAHHLAIAAAAWNNANVGVTFKWVELAKDATFVICNGGPGNGILAQAFFPNQHALNFMHVFSDAFERKWKPNMWKIFTHELGHVLGLRHEFAIEGLPELKIQAERQGAVRLGPRDPRSVMTYSLEPPEMQQSDIDSTKMFYSLRNDANGNPPRVGLTDVVDYVPR